MINYHFHNNKIINLDFNEFVYNFIRESCFNTIKRFIELIPKDLLKQISFYVDFIVLLIIFKLFNLNIINLT